jgi:hypothetical protein
MLRYLFALLLLVHGLIHLMGFAKAFKLAIINQLTTPISKPAGLLWLLTAVLFIGAAILFLLQQQVWWIPAAVALVVSQILITGDWHDAKAGTIANVIVAIASIAAYGNWSFNNMVKKEVNNMLSENGTAAAKVVTKDMLAHLPLPVQTWLLHSGIVGKPQIRTVHLKQKGFMRMKPDTDKWIPTSAEQYFTIDKPAFIWKVNMEMMPLVPVAGRDQFVHGKGQMLIKAFSLFNMVNQADEKIDQGALQRYLAEICWFPSAALSPYITWQAIDDHSAKASMTYNGVSGSVIFYFNKDGDMIRCTADRYKGGGSEATLEKWVVDTKRYGVMNGIKMPVQSEATWKLKEGDYTWYKLEITSIEYQ